MFGTYLGRSALGGFGVTNSESLWTYETRGRKADRARRAISP